ncbi:MAG: DUF4178 domain-containing protein [Acidobacteriota bacterium]
MAGNAPPPPTPSPAPGKIPAPQAPSIKALQCPNCAGSLQVRGLGQTTTIACASCGSVVDMSNDDLRVISTFDAKLTRHPVIPLGTRGTLRGEKYELIGFMCRAITVDSTDYEWSEYLLFNPYKGFRWLTEYNGHWNDVKTITAQPEEGANQTIAYLNNTYNVFQIAEARVTYVLGEFYWQIEVGEKTQVVDYVAPPLMLSKESTTNETAWSLGEYIEPAEVAEAFAVKSGMPNRVGVYGNQPSPFAAKSKLVRRAFTTMVLLAILVQIGTCSIAQNAKVFEHAYRFTQQDRGKAQVTEPFALAGHTSNVVVETTTNLENRWIYLNLALINMDTGQAYDFGREVSYYKGVDDGESWSEGDRNDEAVLPSVPSGQYYLRIEAESETPPVDYQVRVYRDAPSYWFLPLALLALCVYPVVVWLRSRSFESQRWAESDRGSTSTSSDDDDDDSSSDSE